MSDNPVGVVLDLMAGDLPTQDPPRWIRRYLRIPYAKMDCSALADHVLWTEKKVRMLEYPEDLAHTADETLWAIHLREQVKRTVEHELTRWPRVEKPEPFDLALYRVIDRYHVALVVGGGWALNTDLKRGSHPLKLRDSSWEGRLVGYFRHPDLA